MTSPILVSSLFALAVLLPSTLLFAQPLAPRDRVIVQFREEAALDGFAADYREDERAARAPDVWRYQRRTVLGAVMALERRHGFRADAFYSHAIRGFAASVTRAQRAALEQHPLVRVVEDDIPVRLGAPIVPAAQTIPWGIPKVGADLSSAQSGNGSGTVTGVNVYVIDSGIDLTHPDLNVVNSVNFAGGANTDCFGHGTGVAGLIAARDNGDYSVGVAPGAPLTAVKVFTCAGLTLPSVIIQGVDWVTANAVKPAVANMSLGSLIPLSTVNAAVRASAQSGIVYAVAAGNGNPFTGEPLNACGSSPAAVGRDWFGIPNGVITVAATGKSDHETSFSNFGPCVDLWAPGEALESTWLMSEGGMITASGTSFSSPMVAGAAALLLSREPTLPPWLVEYYLKVTAADPETFSKDGAAIRRLQVSAF